MDRKSAALDAEDIAFFRSIALKHSSAVTFGGAIDGNNRSVTLDSSGRILGSYSKINLFKPEGEEKFYRPGKSTVNFKLKGFRVTPFICYDLRFPALFCGEAAGTDLYLVIANFPAVRIEHWKALLKARAIENQAYVIGVNRVGRSPSHIYNGRSMVVDPSGKVMLDCGGREAIHRTDIDVKAVGAARRYFHLAKYRKGSLN